MPIGKPKLKHVYNIWAVILLVWGMYRANLRLPEVVDELIAKPLIFLGPVVWYVRRVEKRSLASIGFAWGKFWRDLKVGIGIGILFGLEGIVANSIKHGQLSFAPVVPVAGLGLFTLLFLSIITSVVEEALSRGFVFGRLLQYYRHESKAIAVGAAMFLLLHVPIMFTTLQLSGVALLVFIITDIIIAVTTSVFYAETKTLTVPVLIHAFWNMTVVLYL